EETGWVGQEDEHRGQKAVKQELRWQRPGAQESEQEEQHRGNQDIDGVRLGLAGMPENLVRAGGQEDSPRDGARRKYATADRYEENQGGTTGQEGKKAQGIGALAQDE